MRAGLLRGLIVALAGLGAAWMLFDGMRALVLGDYVTIDGQLGPWAALVDALGIPPRSFGVKLFFVLFGAVWLATTVAFAIRRAPRGAMVAFALGSLWYLVVGTVLSLALVALLVALGRTPSGARGAIPED